MGRKGKIGILVYFLIVVALGLYRNLGTPFVRFWPLILIDTVTRFPGDKVLELFHLWVPGAVYELMRGLLQFAMIVLLGWGGDMYRRSLRGGKRQARSDTVQDGSLPATHGWFWKKRRALLTLALLGPFMAVPRCGRELTHLASFLTGVHPYSLLVRTGVFVEGPQHKLEMLVTDYAGSTFEEILPSGDPRVPGARSFQDRVLLGKRTPAPLIRPGKISMNELPSGVSQDEALLLERRALDIINAFLDLDWAYDADADLVFSRDGDRASYTLHTYSVDGPLAAIGSDDAVSFIRIKGQWVATRFGNVGSWLS